MSTIDATVSMMEVMPEEERLKVLEFTRELFSSSDSTNPFAVKDANQIFADLEESRRQVEEGKVRPLTDALDDINARYGFI